MTPITVKGLQLLKQELANLKDVVRPKIINDIATARAHGDLKENAEYHAAKEEQSFVEGRIKEITSKIATAQVIDVTKIVNDGTCIFGSTIKLLNLTNDEVITYQIVGEDEADITNNKISCYSPIAKALIGKTEDDEVEIKVPKGIVNYKILKINYI